MTIIINNLHIKYGKKNIIRGLNIKIKPGNCIWIQGDNGSGKTTFLNFLSGSHITKSGYCNVIGNYDFFFISTKTPLHSSLSAKEHLTFWIQCLKPPISTSKLFSYFNIDKISNKKIEELSLGEKKRLILSILNILPYRTIFLLDEPFIGLDKKNKNILSKICQTHLHNHGIILISHHGNLPFQANKILKFPIINQRNKIYKNLETWEI